MKVYKVCLLGAANRNEFISRLRETCHAQNIYVEITSVELSSKKFYPISNEVMVVEGPKFQAGDEFERFARQVLSQFDLIIPMMDEACRALAESVHNNVIVQNQAVVSSLKFTELCTNKIAFAAEPAFNFMPRIPNTPDIYPKIAKPARGYGSKGIFLVESKQDEINLDKENMLIQDFIEGKEVTLDAFYDIDGNFIQGLARERLQVIGGEVNHLVTRDLTPRELELLINLSNFGAKGPINVQTRGGDVDWFVLEINPRFGGGATASMAAGFNMLEMTLLNWLYSKNVRAMPVEHVEMVRSRKDYFRKL